MRSSLKILSRPAASSPPSCQRRTTKPVERSTRTISTGGQVVGPLSALNSKFARKDRTFRDGMQGTPGPNILGSCTALRDSVDEARKGLPVSDQISNTALRNALDLIALGTEDCFEGARSPNIPQLEKSFSELREGDTLLDLARRTIDAWT